MNKFSMNRYVSSCKLNMYLHEERKYILRENEWLIDKKKKSTVQKENQITKTHK